MEIKEINAFIDAKYKSNRGNLRVTEMSGNSVFLSFSGKPKFDVAFVAKSLLKKFPSMYWVYVGGGNSYTTTVYSRETLSWLGY